MASSGGAYEHQNLAEDGSYEEEDQFEAEMKHGVRSRQSNDDELQEELLDEEQYAYDDQHSGLPDDALYEEEYDEDDEEYDGDFNDEELSSSPSIPDENINFDLVYALHTFVATVDGQATVQKGDNLVLLDDSNSYWWLVRVMASQEVGYIPAENIETPYERLARLNKHRNVQITTATDDDHDNEPAHAYSGYLVKASTRGAINQHSGKPSALSSRERSTSGSRGPPKEKRAVLFGHSEYVEHSGNEASDDDDDLNSYELDHDEEYEDEYEQENDESLHERSTSDMMANEDQIATDSISSQDPSQPAEREDDSNLHPTKLLTEVAGSVGSVAAGAIGTAAAALGVQRSDSDASNGDTGRSPKESKPSKDTLSPSLNKSPVMGLFSPSSFGDRDGVPNSSSGNTVPLRMQEEKKQRPGSLVGMPGSVPMFNVVRVFAGENVESDATFKTVLLNKTMTSADLVRQAMQRFDIEDDAADYVMVLRRLDGEEHVLWTHESPLQILESLSELQDEDHGPHGTPGQSRDSVGSLTSLLQDANASRVTYDFSDDRYGKFYLVRKGPYFQREASMSQLAPSAPDLSADVSGRSGVSNVSNASDSVLGASSTWRFTLQVALFPSDLPEGVVFHPQTGLATPQNRQHALPASVKPQIRLLRFTRNTTVAEVIEAGLAAFQVMEGVVDGGDDVETRAGRGRAKYGLTSVTDSGEFSLHPTSKVLAAYETLPEFKQVDINEIRRHSLDQTLTHGVQEDLNESDPLFVLRQVRYIPREKTFSPSESTPRISSTMSAFPDQSDSSRQSLHTEPQGQPRRVSSRLNSLFTPRLTVEHNDAQGVDLVMRDGVRLRSSRSLDSQQVRYSLHSQGSEHDVSDRLRDVLETMTTPQDALSQESTDPTRGSLNKTNEQGDLLERFAEKLPTMGERSVSDNIDLMLNRILNTGSEQSSETPLPTNIEAVAPPKMIPAAALEQTRGLNIPNKMTTNLQRSGSLRSVSASDATAPRNTVIRNALAKGWANDRVVSDSTAATGTGRLRETYNIHALYGIVDALVIEAKADAREPEDPVPRSNSSLRREHRRQTSTSSTTSLQSQLHRTPHSVQKLLEPTAAEKLASASQGLFALPFPTANHSFKTQQGSVPRHYTSLISQVNSMEAALDELLRAALTPSD
ncbi:protein phosphatase regulator [Malassezia psittaci]|uniref:Protein phosphatase regulator n=1 Tax=Malassezia psittaci TaxID=1821823 RepID=A0AAF0JJC2_9BASI|nr:protein phosphatase regulator [Malassezia psittaci]